MRRSRGFGRPDLAALAGWVLVTPTVATAVARLARREGTTSVLMAEAFGPLLGLPALAALALAAVTRRRRLAGVATAVVSLHLAWLAGELRQAKPTTDESGSRPGPGEQGRRVRLFSANVLFTNTDLDGIAGEVRDSDPDVVILQEVSPPTVAALTRAGTVDRFPHQALNPRPDPLGTAILSRFPLEDIEACAIGGQPMSRATVVVGDHRLRLYNVHTRAPFGPGGFTLWKAQLAALADIVGTEKRPLVLAGDFNASSGHRPFRSLLAAGMRDAHMVCRRWWVTTWPSNMRLAPPFARIDHVLVSPQVDVLAVSEGIGRSSDHRPVIADLSVGD